MRCDYFRHKSSLTFVRDRHWHFQYESPKTSSSSSFFHQKVPFYQGNTLLKVPFKGILAIYKGKIPLFFGKIMTTNGFMTQKC